MLWSAASSTSEPSTAGSGKRGMSSGTRKRAATTAPTTNVSVPTPGLRLLGTSRGTWHQRRAKSRRCDHPLGVTRSAVEAQLAPDLLPWRDAVVAHQHGNSLLVVVDPLVVVEPGHDGDRAEVTAEPDVVEADRSNA